MNSPAILPLAGRTVVVTRARAQAASLVSALEYDGAQVVLFPTIQIVPVAREPIRSAIDALGSYDWVIFTSTNGVECFFSCLEHGDQAPDLFGRVRVAAIGTATAAALEERQVRPLCVPERAEAEGLLDALGTGDWHGRRVLVPRAETGRELLPDELRRRGADVDILVVYRTVRPPTDPGPLRAALTAGEVSAITFTSSSTVRHFSQYFDAGEAVDLVRSAHVAVASIGSVTSATAREEGLEVLIEASVSTVDGLVSALRAYFSHPN